MYSVIKYTKKTDLSGYDYIFKNFKEFYNVADYLYMPLIGVYKIAIITHSTEDVESFLSQENRYSHLSVSIFMEEQAIAVLESHNPEAHFEETVNSYEVFKQLISERNFLFDRYMIYRLYRSIDHDTVSMMNALDKISNNRQKNELITEELLSKLFVLNDIVYPSQVLMRFLNMEGKRWDLLHVCLSQIDNDVIVGSIVKELKKFVISKAEYFKTGQTSDRIKKLNTQNLITAYRVFVAERGGINDAFILFKFYENGLSTIDIKGGRNVSI